MNKPAPKPKSIFPDTMPEDPNLVATWMFYTTEVVGRTLTAGVERMNRVTGKKTTTSRVYEWQSGKRRPDPEAIRFMIGDCGPWVIGQAVEADDQRHAWAILQATHALAP